MKEFYSLSGITLFFLTFLFPIVGLSQGNTCADAVNIAALPYTSPGGLFQTSHSTCGAGDNYTSANSRCANDYLDGEDFVYSFTPASNMCIDATLSLGALASNITSLFITEECPDSQTGRCMAQAINIEGGGCEVTNVSLTAGKTYYILVVEENGDCFDYTLDVVESASCPTPPTGFNCDYADNINSLPSSISGSTCGHTSFMNDGNECYSTIYHDGPSYFYEYTATNNECVKLIGKTSGTTLRFSIHDTCPTFTDTTCVTSLYFYGTEYTRYANLDSGKTYYFVISGSTCADYDIRFEPIGNEGASCASAIEIDSTFFELPNQTTKCKGDYYKEEDDCSSFYYDGNEMVFKYESPGGECISASAYNMSSYGGIYLFKDCPSVSNDSNLANDLRCGFYDPKEVGIEYTIEDPGTYYILVAGRQYYWNDTYYDIEFDFRFSSTPKDDYGKDCDNLHTLPSNTSVSEPGISVQCKGNDYTPADACDNNLITGNDYVFEYTAPADFCGVILGKNTAGNGGLILMDACPSEPNANCLGAVGCETECDSIYMDYVFEAGKTYYIVAASATGNYFAFDLAIRKANNTADGCTECADADCEACKNADFELGNLERWNGFTGVYATPKQTPGLDRGNINDPDARHSIMNAGGYDPVVGPALRTTGPLGGRYAHRLGNRSTGAQAEVLTYEFTVTNTTKNFFYYYAVVFEDPSHPVAEQPFFSVEMVAIDGNGSETSLGCAEYEVRPDPADPTFQETSNQLTGSGVIRWKDWTLVTIPLDNYVGQDVRLEFTTKDCDQSGHFGYAYIDAFCGDIEIGSNKGDSYTICPGESVTLSAPEGFQSYDWSNGETTREITVNQAGTYTVNLIPFSTNPLLNCDVSLDAEVVVAEVPTAQFSLDEGCNDAFVDFVFEGSGSAQYPFAEATWYFGDGTTSHADSAFTHTFPGPGNYDISLVVTNDALCKDSTAQSITIAPYTTLGNLNAIDTIVICQFDSTNLFAQEFPNTNYLWEGPEGFSSTDRESGITLNDTLQTGNYILLAQSTEDTCVFDYDTTYIHVVPFPEFSLTPDTNLCFTNNQFVLHATGGETYNWASSPYITTNYGDSVRVEPTVTDSFLVTISNSVCPDSTMQATIIIDTYNQLITLPDTVFVCQGDSLFVEGLASPVTYSTWTTPNHILLADSNLNIDTAKSEHEGYAIFRTYLGEDEYCLFDTDSVYLSPIPAPSITFNADTLFACENESLVFGANRFHSNVWTNSNGDTLSTSETVSVSSLNADYFFTATSQLGCSSTDSVRANQIEIIDPDLGNNRTFCLGDVKTIRPFNAIPSTYSYLWNNSSTLDSLVVTSSQMVTLRLEYNGCFTYDTIQVTFQNPDAFSMGNDTLLCSDDSLTLDFRGFGDDILWQDGNTSFVRTIYPPGGEYEVTITSGACVLENDISISFENKLFASLPTDQAICLEDTITLYGNPTGYTYNWLVNSVATSTADSIFIFQVGTYEVVLEARTSVCFTSDTTEVQVLSPNGLNLPDQHMCVTDSVLADASISFAGATYLWNDGITTPSRYCKAAGQYSVIVTAGPCTILDTFLVTTDQVPTIDLGPDLTICESDSTLLLPDNSSWPQYTWDTGENTTNIYGFGDNTYRLTAINGLCSFTDSTHISQDLIPVFDLGGNPTICQGDSALLTTGMSGLPVVWESSETTHAIYAKTSGKYKATITNGTCTYSDSLVVNVQTPPTIDLGEDQVLCFGDSTQIGQAIPNASYSWNGGVHTTSTIWVTTGGEYILSATQEECTVSDTVNVAFDNLDKPNLGNDFTVCETLDTTLSSITSAQYFVWNTGDTSNILSVNQPGTYIVTAIQGTCSDKDTIEITVQPQHSIDLGVDTVLCEGQTYIFPVSTNAETPSFSWNNTTSTDPYRSISTSGIYILSVTSGVCTNSDTAQVIVVPNPFIDLAIDGEICEDDSVSIGDTFNHPEVAYNWNTGEIDSAIVVHEAGTYVETARIAHCYQSDAYNLSVVYMPHVNLGDDVAECEYRVPQIGWSGRETDNYSWNTSDTTPFIHPQNSGLYELTVQRGPCVVTDNIEVTIYPIPVQDFGSPVICPGDSLLLEVDCPGCEVVWNSELDTNVFVAYPSMGIALEVTSPEGCKYDEFIITHKNTGCHDDIFIPNSFTPDGDGHNDEFFPVHSGLIEVISFSIFDRWGKRIHHSQYLASPWDGVYQGKLCQQGVYNYTLVYRNRYRMKRIEKGVVNLFR